MKCLPLTHYSLQSTSGFNLEMYGAYAQPEHEEDSSSGTFSLASLANIKHGKKLGKTKNLVSVIHIYFSLITITPISHRYYILNPDKSSAFH